MTRPIAEYRQGQLYLDRGFAEVERVSPEFLRIFRATLNNLNPVSHAERIKTIDQALEAYRNDHEAV